MKAYNSILTFCILLCICLIGNSSLAQGLVWAKVFGGNNDDWIHDIEVDKWGNLYCFMGNASSSSLYPYDLDPSSATVMDSMYGVIAQYDSEGNYVSKLNPEGSPTSLSLMKMLIGPKGN